MVTSCVTAHRVHFCNQILLNSIHCMTSKHEHMSNLKTLPQWRGWGGRGRGGRSFQQMESTLTLGAGQRARHSVRQDLCVHLWICLLLWVKLVWCHICTCIKVFPAEDQSSHWFVTSFNPRPSKANKESVFRIRSPHKSLPWHAPWWSGKRRCAESALFKVCQEQEEAHLWVH